MITINNLSFRYGKTQLFNQLDLSVREGNIYGLLGKNGAGKSTLLKIISGMLFADQGTCSIKSIPSSKRLPSMLEDIYYLPEEFYLPSLTTSEYEVMYGQLYPDFKYQEFHNYLKEFEIENIGDKRLSKLSLGQKKKYLLAFGLASGASLLLFDEPTNGLDIPSKRQFRRLVSMAMSDNRTIIISTHQVKDVENLIDPVVILDEGRILLNESIEVINRKLKVLTEKEKNPDALYSEENLNGFTNVLPNGDGEEGEMDLEILFNTVVSSKGQIGEILKKEVQL